MMEEMLHSATENDSDVVICGVCVEFTKENRIENCYAEKASFTKDDHNFGLLSFELQRKRLFNHAWNKLYKRSLIEASCCRFRDLMPSEDLLFNYDVFKNADTVSIVSDCFYHYIRRDAITILSSYHPDFSFLYYKLRFFTLISSSTLLMIIKQFILPFIISLIAVMSIWGFVNPVDWLYPVTMFALLLYMLYNKNIRIDKSIAFFVFACVLSIVINDPNPIFRSWERLAYFVMILLGLSPIICNYKMSFFRMKIFSSTLILLILSSVLSFIGYFLGVNFMRYDGSNMAEIVSGSFAGITAHSMILGPVSALSCCYLFSCLFNPAFKKKIRILLFAAFVASVGSLLLSASRGALIGGVAGLLFVLYKLHADRVGRFIKYLVLIIGIGAASFPLWVDIADMVMSKQQGNLEAGSAFSSRDRKWNARQAEFESSPIFGIGFAIVDPKLDQNVNNGSIEPGTSWGGVLSMLGILGFIPFCYIIFSNFFYLLKDTRNKLSSACLGGCLSFFMMHLIVEGYLLAAGSYLCFLFWLLLGVIGAQRKNNLTVFLLK